MVQTVEQIQTSVSPLAKKYGLKKVYLFGSFANNAAHDASDVDLLVEKGSPLSLLALAGFREDAKEALQRDVDVITTAGIAQDFWHEIKGTEVLLYEA